MNVYLVVWLVTELAFLSFPDFVKYLAFFDGLTFRGVQVRSHCTGGDVTTNARLLMCAWTISFLLTTYVAVVFSRDENFYPLFIAKIKELVAKTFTGKYAPARFRYYALAVLFGSLAFVYYFYMFAGYLDDGECTKSWADKALLIQGAIVVIGGNFLGLLIALGFGASKARKLKGAASI